MAITEQQRAALAAQYPDVVSAVNRLAAIQPQAAPALTAQDFMSQWQAQRQANYDAAGPVLEAAATARRQAVNNRNSPSVTLGNGGEPIVAAPPERTEADFQRAIAAVAQAKAEGKQRHKNRSKLTPEQLAANATAFREAKKTQAAQGGSLQQQASRFKRMMRLGYNDPITMSPTISPEDEFAMQMLRQQFEAGENQRVFGNQMSQNQFDAQRTDAANALEMEKAKQRMQEENQAFQHGIGNREMTVAEQVAQNANEQAIRDAALREQLQKFQQEAFNRQATLNENRNQWQQGMAERRIGMDESQQQFNQGLATRGVDMAQGQQQFDQGLASRQAALEERRVDMANQIATKRMEIEQGRYTSEMDRQKKLDELSALQQQFERDMQTSQFDEQQQQNAWERQQATAADGRAMSDRDKALIGMIGQFDPETAARIAASGSAGINVKDVYRSLSDAEREQIANEYGDLSKHTWADFLNPFASDRTYTSRLTDFQKKLIDRLKRRGLSPEAIADEFNRVIPDNQYRIQGPY